MAKSRNLRRNRTPPRREEEEPSPQPRQTPEGSHLSETSEDVFAEAMQPREFFFNEKEYTKQCKFQPRCDQDGVVKYFMMTSVVYRAPAIQTPLPHGGRTKPKDDGDVC